MIPRTIHYCWFGKGKKDKLFDRCLESWKKFFPGHEIIEWNEDNFAINYNDYTKEAYEAKKYAFVSDVARLKVLYEHGGIYFDTDVEVIKKFPNEILKKGYLAEEEEGIIATGLGFAALPGNKAIKIMLDDYNGLHFKKGDDIFDTIPCPKRNSSALLNAGYQICAGEKIAGIPVFDNRYFCGYDYKNHHSAIYDQTLSIHHYAASWQNNGLRLNAKIKHAISGMVGLDNYRKIRRIKHNFKKM